MPYNIRKFPLNFALFEKIFELDRAVFYGILLKLWSVVSGSVNVILVSTFFSSSLQGYYYTFNTLIALQVFVELGLGIVTQQFASHEWAKLSFNKKGDIIGDEDALSKLRSLARISFKWFFIGGIVLTIGLMIGGYFYFSPSQSHDNIQWLMPWMLLSVLTGVNIFFVPFWSLLEGCNQVKNLYGFRLFQGMAFSVSIWIFMACGSELWTAAFASVVLIISNIVFVKLKYLNFFKSLLLLKPSGPKINWFENLMPMQIRIAVSWISGYFSFSLFVPILFKYQGPEVAGQFGMTWGIIAAIGGIASSWLSPKIPKFAILISKGDYTELDKLFWKIVKIVFGVIFLLSAFLWLFVFILPIIKTDFSIKLSSRILSPDIVAIFLIAQILQIASTPFSAYMRAHKREPLMYLSILAGALIGLSTFFFGKYFSVFEVALGYLTVNALIIPMVVIVWYNERRSWIRNANRFRHNLNL